MPMLKFNNTKDNNNSIKVIGVGGGGSNAVNNMFREGIKDVDFIVANTDAQALEQSPVPIKLQLGKNGKGAGSKPEVGREAAMESQEQIEKILGDNTEMLFITAGMGGGTGTGAAPVIAGIAKQKEILTVGIVTIPFQFEGPRRRKQADQGVIQLQKNVDTILIILNEKIREIHQDLSVSNAFKKADNILTTAAKGIAELITVPGMVNVDFEDVKTVMKNGGKALMSSATAEGENRALKCAEMALTSPLLADNSINGAENLLLYVASSDEKEMSITEMNDITDFIQEQSGKDTNIIFGNSLDNNLGQSIRITIVATGFEKKIKKEDTKIIKKLYDQKNDSTIEESTIQDSTTEKTATQEETYPIANESVEPEAKDLEEQQDYKVSPLYPDEDEETEIKKHTYTGDIEQESSPEFDFDSAETTENQKSSSDQPKQKQEPELFSDDESSLSGNFQFTKKKKRLDDPLTENDDMLQKQRNERVEKLSYIGKAPKRRSPLTDHERQHMEKIPAFKRRSIHLEDTPDSEEENDPEYVLGKNKNEEVTIKKNNGYIHKNVD
jgi:cell division protein FtsZ